MRNKGTEAQRKVKTYRVENRQDTACSSVSLFLCAFAPFCLLLFGLLVLPNIALAFSKKQAISAEVNGVPVLTASVEREVRGYLRQIGHRDLSIERMDLLRKQMTAKLIDEELIYQEAVKKGWAATDAETEEEVARIRKRFLKEGDFEAALVREEMTLGEVREGVRRFILIRKMRNAFSSSSEAEKQAWLEEIRKRSEIRQGSD